MTSLLVCFLLQNANPSIQPAMPGQQPATSTAPSRAVGPMRVELMGLQETRRWYAEPPAGAPSNSELILQVRVVGQRLDDIVRIGRVVLTEVTDDRGASLAKPDAMTEAQKSETNRVRGTPEQLREMGMMMSAKSDAPTRGASMLTKVRGTVRGHCATKFEDIAIKGIPDRRGKMIDNARLKELDIEIRVLAPDNPSALPHNAGMVGIEYVRGGEKVRSIDFFDANLARMRVQPRNAQTNEGKPCTIYHVSENQLAEDVQMVIQVWPTLETIDIPVELDNVKLP